MSHPLDKEKFFVYVDLTTEDIPRPFYVGKGNQNRLWRVERNKHHKHIAKKYGRNRVVVLETHDEQFAFDQEIRLIAEHRTFVYADDYEFGANYTAGGDGTSGHRLTPEQSREHRERVRSSWQDPIIRQKRIDSRNREETNKKLRVKASASQKQNWQNPEYRASQSEAIRVAQNVPETREKRSNSNSISQTKLWQDPEYHQRQCVKQQEVWSDPELLTKHSEGQKDIWKDDEERRQKYSQRMKNNNPSKRPEVMAKIIASQKGKPKYCSICHKAGHKRPKCPNVEQSNG